MESRFSPQSLEYDKKIILIPAEFEGFYISYEGFLFVKAIQIRIRNTSVCLLDGYSINQLTPDGTHLLDRLH